MRTSYQLLLSDAKQSQNHFHLVNGKFFLEYLKIEKQIYHSSRICHDTATGVHYGVISCEGCKVCFLGKQSCKDRENIYVGFFQTMYYPGCSKFM
jgi:hypothetical protein